MSIIIFRSVAKIEFVWKKISLLPIKISYQKGLINLNEDFSSNIMLYNPKETHSNKI